MMMQLCPQSTTTINKLNEKIKLLSFLFLLQYETIYNTLDKYQLIINK